MEVLRGAGNEKDLLQEGIVREDFPHRQEAPDMRGAFRLMRSGKIAQKAQRIAKSLQPGNDSP